MTTAFDSTSSDALVAMDSAPDRKLLLSNTGTLSLEVPFTTAEPEDRTKSPTPG